MFAAHPEVYIPLDETTIFLRQKRRAAKKYEELEAEARETGAKYLAEKTPRHIRHLDLIREIADEPRFVIVVRDGRDVAASIARRRDDRRVKPGIRRWVQDNRIAIQERGKDDVMIYRHERLVEKPAKTLRAICRFAGIPFREEMLRYHEQERLWFQQEKVAKGDTDEMHHNELRNWQVNQPIFDNSGRWKTELSEDDLKPFQDGRAARLMRRFGYQ